MPFKAKVTWLGEDDLHPEGAPIPQQTNWRDKVMKKGEAVEFEGLDQSDIDKLKGNKYFKVESVTDTDTGPTTASPVAGASTSPTPAGPKTKEK